MGKITLPHKQATHLSVGPARQVSLAESAVGDWVLLFIAYLKLIHFDRYLARGDFARLRTDVHVSARSPAPFRLGSIDRIQHAVDTACIWYWKEALCLQRSATLACLLRQDGVPAQLVVGVQQLPFKAHAWVEVNRRVINDKAYMRDIYTVLEVF